MKTRRMPDSRVSSLSPGRIVLGYTVIAILWIAFSDAVVEYLNLPIVLMTIKGTVFVFVTAALLYFTIQQLVRAAERAAQERDETADLYRTMVQASHEGVCLLDESGRISFLNEHLATILGRPAAELQGQRLQDFLEEPQVLALPGTRQSETRECRLRKDSDPKPWVLISRHPVLNEAGEVVRLVVTVTDVSERKRADQALSRSDAYPAPVPASQANLGESQLSGPLRYGLAMISVGAALGMGLLLQHFEFRVPAALLFFAIAISSWYGGIGPGVLAVLLSAIGHNMYFTGPVGRRSLYLDWSDVPYYIAFVSFTLLISWFATIRRRIEAGLREQATLLDLTHDTVFVMDMKGVIKYWNHGAEEQHGWSAEQAVGRVVHQLLKTVFPKPLEEIKAELIRTGRYEAELVHTKKDGTKVAVASRWSLQRDRQGAPLAILETNNDISERKRAEEALSRSNRELRAVSNCNQVLLRATDEQSLLNEICRIVCEEASYSAAWVGFAEHDEAKCVRAVAVTGVEEGAFTNFRITWADTERGRGPCGTAIRTGKTSYIENYQTDPRGAPWKEIISQRGFRSAIGLPLKDEHGNTFGSLNIYSSDANSFTTEEIRLLEELAGDLAFGIVTLRSRAARKKAEEELALLSFALDKVHEAAFLLDETSICYVNEEACRRLGYTREELLGMRVSDIDPDFPAERWSDHWRDLKAQQSLTFESRQRTRDGRIFPTEISANYFEYGGRAYNLALVRDITERKRAEQALQTTQAELAHVARLTTMGELTSSIAHEVNQPLTAIVTSGNACLRWLSNDPPNVDEARQLISRIVKDGHRASDVVGRIRGFFKKSAPERVNLEINHLIKDVITMVPGELSRNRVQVKTELAGDLPPVIGDPIQLQQVLLNLMINGIEAMSNVDGVRELLIKSQRYESDSLLVAVQDNGAGFDEQKANQVFEAFYTTKSNGLGLGLSISKTIIEAYGGRLWATTNNGHGATFQFTLPAK